MKVSPRRAKKSIDWEATLVWHCQVAGLLPEPVRELVFAPPRKFRFDLAFEAEKLAVEIDGITYVKGSHQAGGRHTSITGLRAECEKSALAAAHGWRVLHVLPDHVKSGQALIWIEQALGMVSRG